MEIIPIDYDLSSVLNDLVNMVQTRADDKGLLLKLEFDPNTPKRLHGDEVRIKQIITNILTNAVKYTEKGSVTFAVSFERTSDEDVIFLNVSVRDTGIGIKEEDMAKLFSEFERIEEKRNRNIEGTGLGMNITQRLLGMMGSALKVESVYGEGSVFSFRLEQHVTAWEELGDYEESYRASLSKRSVSKARLSAPNAIVLVVDDTPMNLMVFKSLLKRTKVRIDTAASGDEGLALSYDKKYDMIFLDHMMPQKDGIETLHELRSREKDPNINTPTICLTANAISGAREKYLAEGFDDYLTKPIDSVKLEEMLLNYLPAEKIEEAADEEPVADTAAAKPEIPDALQPLSGQDWIDISLGIKNSGDTETYLPLLKIFYESMDDKAEEIERFYAEENWSDYTIKVHALKSSARLIGATGFAKEAQQLENAGKSSDIAYIRANHRDFMTKLQGFKAPLEEIFLKQEEENKPEADADLLAVCFDEIHAAAEDCDYDRLDNIFNELSAYRIPTEHEERFRKILDAAKRFDYDAIKALFP
ncbi:MAG: response regulator [Lachnospiraceae bacterium]|nr:response regulator [Lachnospiraceae bacterium]